MTTETMNVHQALAELKMMDKRIEAATREPEWVITNKHSNTKINGVSVDEWKADIKAKYQKVLDLIRRRDAIKRAVVNSNAVTKITVAGKEYTVAEAIDRKNNGVEYQKKLVFRLNHDYAMCKGNADRANGSELERRADEHVRIMFGNSDMKGSSQEAVRVRNEFIAAQTTDIIDPIGVLAEIEKINDEVNSFLMNVDAALSVSNALTVITVEY
jgi:hypothetical protein